MSKILMILPLIILTFLILFTSQALAASLTVTKIGALDLGGQMYNEWWYSGTNPTLYGTAESNAEVTVTIGETAGTTTADGSGSWSYAGQIATGDHAIVVTSGAETVSFTLHAGQAYDASAAAAATTTTTKVTGETTKGGIPVPETGPKENIIMAFFVSTVLIGLGVKGLRIATYPI